MDAPPDLGIRAHAILFAEGGSLSHKRLLQILECKDEELLEALDTLASRLQGSGLTLVRTAKEASLAIADVASDSVKKAFSKELGREIGDAGLEVLAIVLYQGPSTRSQIDYIRGVNTTSTLRNLLARGLLERAGNPEDAREYVYGPTTDLLAHLGVEDDRSLPDYGTISSELAAFEAQREQFTHGGTTDTTLGSSE